MKNNYLEQFNKEYQTRGTIIKNNLENLTYYQKIRILQDLKKIIDNVENNSSLYRSDYNSLLLLLKDLQFYEFLQREDV